uniref:Uncharacterized protein n=1 Tax=Megaselia scalaris TaxID=36166 RepID=T1GIY4_MEGSC
ETDPEATAPATSRPRAGSLDQFNLRYSQTTSSSLGGGNGSRGFIWLIVCSRTVGYNIKRTPNVNSSRK